MLLPYALLLYMPLKQFCQTHLIADDPYQYEELTEDQLIAQWFSLKNNKPPLYSEVLAQEILRRIERLKKEDDPEKYYLIETITKTLRHK